MDRTVEEKAEVKTMKKGQLSEDKCSEKHWGRNIVLYQTWSQPHTAQD